MKKILLIFSLFLVMANYSFAAVNQYTVDEDALEQVFENSVVSPLFITNDVSSDLMDLQSTGMSFEGEKKPVVAFVLATFLGILGIHRAYMGTEATTVVGYILTLGGCGIVATVDWVLLLIGAIEDDISEYVNNPKFFMW